MTDTSVLYSFRVSATVASWIHTSYSHMCKHWRGSSPSFTASLTHTFPSFTSLATWRSGKHLFSPYLFGVISLYWVTRFLGVTVGTHCSPLDFFTSWTSRNFPLIPAVTASCHFLLLLNRKGRKKWAAGRAGIGESESWKAISISAYL